MSVDAERRSEIEAWTEDQVVAWLSSLNSEVSKYAGVFRLNNITGKRLLALNAEKLVKLGISSVDHQNCILDGAQALIARPKPAINPQALARPTSEQISAEQHLANVVDQFSDQIVTLVTYLSSEYIDTSSIVVASTKALSFVTEIITMFANHRNQTPFWTNQKQLLVQALAIVGGKTQDIRDNGFSPEKRTEMTNGITMLVKRVKESSELLKSEISVVGITRGQSLGPPSNGASPSISPSVSMAQINRNSMNLSSSATSMPANRNSGTFSPSPLGSVSSPVLRDPTDKAVSDYAEVTLRLAERKNASQQLIDASTAKIQSLDVQVAAKGLAERLVAIEQQLNIARPLLDDILPSIAKLTSSTENALKEVCKLLDYVDGTFSDGGEVQMRRQVLTFAASLIAAIRDYVNSNGAKGITNVGSAINGLSKAVASLAEACKAKILALVATREKKETDETIAMQKRAEAEHLAREEAQRIAEEERIKKERKESEEKVRLRATSVLVTPPVDASVAGGTMRDRSSTSPRPKTEFEIFKEMEAKGEIGVKPRETIRLVGTLAGSATVPKQEVNGVTYTKGDDVKFEVLPSSTIYEVKLYLAELFGLSSWKLIDLTFRGASLRNELTVSVSQLSEGMNVFIMDHDLPESQKVPNTVLQAAKVAASLASKSTTSQPAPAFSSTRNSHSPGSLTVPTSASSLAVPGQEGGSGGSGGSGGGIPKSASRHSFSFAAEKQAALDERDNRLKAQKMQVEKQLQDAEKEKNATLAALNTLNAERKKDKKAITDAKETLRVKSDHIEFLQRELEKLKAEDDDAETSLMGWMNRCKKKGTSESSWKRNFIVLTNEIQMWNGNQPIRDVSLNFYTMDITKSPNANLKLRVDLVGSRTDIAYTYKKRQNVFFVQASDGKEFLFQAEDHRSMLLWVKSIQAASLNEAETVQTSMLKLTMQTVGKKQAKQIAAALDTPPATPTITGSEDAPKIVGYAQATLDYEPVNAGTRDLRFHTGDIVFICKRSEDGWFEGMCGGSYGNFHNSFVKEIDKKEADKLVAQMKAAMGTTKKRTTRVNPVLQVS